MKLTMKQKQNTLKKQNTDFTLFAFASLLLAISLISACGLKYDFIDTPKDIAGNKESPLRVVEFSDLECPACRASHPTLKKLIEEYGDRVGFEFNHYPLSGHPNAYLAAQGAECANDQGKFWEFIDDSYLFQNKLKKNDLIDRAQKLGLDVENFKACLNSGTKKQVVDADMRDGKTKFLKGTPTYYVDGRELDYWDYDSFKAEIESSLARYSLTQETEGNKTLLNANKTP